MEIRWTKWLSAGADNKNATDWAVALVMKFILKQYEQKSATQIFIFQIIRTNIVPIYSINILVKGI